MTPPPKKRTADDVDVMLETVLREGVNLTTWEESFIESLSTQLGLGRSLTEKQLAILERIYAERTP